MFEAEADGLRELAISERNFVSLKFSDAGLRTEKASSCSNDSRSIVQRWRTERQQFGRMPGEAASTHCGSFWLVSRQHNRPDATNQHLV